MKAISPTSLKKSCELWGIPEKPPILDITKCYCNRHVSMHRRHAPRLVSENLNHMAYFSSTTLWQLQPRSDNPRQIATRHLAITYFQLLLYKFLNTAERGLA